MTDAILMWGGLPTRGPVGNWAWPARAIIQATIRASPILFAIRRDGERKPPSACDPLIALHTPRLILRRWRDTDRAPFAQMNADPRVMQFMPSLLTLAESDALVDRIEAHFDQHGFGLYAVEIPGEGFLGFVGMTIPTFTAHFTPCVEIGWRIAASHWNRGIATEAARAVLAQAFGPLGFKEVVSFTAPANLASRRVMEKIGMTHNPADDFDHPRLPEGHPLRRHVLYRAFG